VDAFSEDSGKQIVTDLEASVKRRLSEQWQQTSERVDREIMADRVLPVVSKFIDDTDNISKWLPNKAEFEYMSTANLLSDNSPDSRQFILQLDIDGNKIIDRPEEVAAAWMVKKYGQEAMPIARKLASGTLRYEGDRDKMRQLYDSFTTLVGQLSGGTAEAAAKVSASTAEDTRKLLADFDQVRRMPTVDKSQEGQAWNNYKITGVVPTNEWLPASNPRANVVEIGDQKYLARNPIMAQTLRDAFGSSLDEDTKNALLSVVGTKNGYLGSVTGDQLRVITGAISNRDDALVDMSSEKDKIFFQTMNADIAAEGKRSTPDKAPVTGKPNENLFYTKGGATADHISLAPIRDVINSRQDLLQLWRIGIDSRNPRWAKMAYQLARESIRNETSTEIGTSLNRLDGYVDSLRSTLGVGAGLDISKDRDQIMRLVQRKLDPTITSEPGVNAADLAVASDVVGKISNLSADLKNKYGEYQALGLVAFGGNDLSIKETLKWTDQLKSGRREAGKREASSKNAQWSDVYVGTPSHNVVISDVLSYLGYSREQSGAIIEPIYKIMAGLGDTLSLPYNTYVSIVETAAREMGLVAGGNK
jgi:hypothetical protein